MNVNDKGVHGAVAKATGWSAPIQGSNHGCRTFMLRGLPLEFSYQKKFMTSFHQKDPTFLSVEGNPPKL